MVAFLLFARALYSLTIRFFQKLFTDLKSWKQSAMHFAADVSEHITWRISNMCVGAVE